MGIHPLKAYREKHGLRPAQLARFLGVTRPTVHRWETGERQVALRLLDDVAEKTGIPKAELRPDLAELMEAAQ